MIVFLWLFNFVISILNAWGCGKSWTESKAVGGLPHFLNWCGAIMSAIGFTWCYMLITGWVGYTIPFEHEVNGTKITAPYFNEADLQFMYDVGYLAIVAPLIGSGLVITVNSWCAWWRSRTFGDGAVAAYNSFAMYHNIYSAVDGVGDAFSRIGSRSSSSSGDKDKNTWIMILVALCLVGGALTTRWIIKQTQLSTATNRRFRYENVVDKDYSY